MVRRQEGWFYMASWDFGCLSDLSPRCRPSLVALRKEHSPSNTEGQRTSSEEQNLSFLKPAFKHCFHWA